MRKVFLFLIGIVIFSSCKKEDSIPVYSVTFTLYSIHTPYIFSYTDKTDIAKCDTITTQNFTKTFEVTSREWDRVMGASNIGTTFPDSLYVSADMDGKTKTVSHRTNVSGSFGVSLQLSQLQ